MNFSLLSTPTSQPQIMKVFAGHPWPYIQHVTFWEMPGAVINSDLILQGSFE
jgi:hypothetical protein